MVKKYVIKLSGESAKKFEEILKDEGLTPAEWLENAIDDYDS